MRLSDFFPTTNITVERGNTTKSVTPSKVSTDIGNLINNFKSGVVNALPKPKAKQVKAQPQVLVTGDQPVTPPQQPVASPKPVATPAPKGKIQGFKRGEIDPEFADLIVQSSQKYGLNPALLAGTLFQESGIDRNVRDNVSVMESGIRSRDRGLAQISDYWHPDVADEQAYDPNFAIDFMAKTLSNNYKKTGKLSEAVAAYNVGLGRVGEDPSRPGGLGPFGQKYVRGVSQNLEEQLARELGLY